MRAMSLCAIATMMATLVGCQDSPQSNDRIALTTADPAIGIAGEFVSGRHGTYSFRAGRDVGTLGGAELRDASGAVVVALAARGDGQLTLTVGGRDASGALHGDEAAEQVLVAFAQTAQAKAVSDFAVALAQATEGAPTLATYVEVFALIDNVVDTATGTGTAANNVSAYAACDSCIQQCAGCYMLPDWLGGICLGISCSGS